MFRSWRRSPAVFTAAGWLVGLTVTGLILGTPYLVFGYHNPSLHLVLDSVDGCVALLAAYLVYGRYRRTRGLRELLLAEGLFLLAVAGLGLTLLLGLLQSSSPETLEVWLPLTVRVIGGALIAAAALSGGTRVGPERRWIGLAPWALIALAAVVLWLQGAGLPVAVDASPPASAQRPVITGHPVLLAAQGFTALTFVVASVGFTAQAARRRDQLVLWLGPACALAAFARINYLLFPSIYTDWLYTGDLLRTGFYLVLLGGAAREIGEYWSAQARAAVLEDRRRLARELHDGVVQEISFIRAEAHSVAAEPEVAERIIGACDRAGDEARAAIDALGRTPDEPLGIVLHRAAREIADRYQGHLEVDLDDSVSADVDQRHALVRITREAVSNALRHGHAARVRIRLGRDQNGRRLVVEDDGRGFDLGATSTGINGYGLTSMRDRAQALPGEFRLTSTPGHGTKVGVSW